MNKRKIYFIGLVFLVIALGSPGFIFAAEETSTMMCDEGVVNIGDTGDGSIFDRFVGFR